MFQFPGKSLCGFIGVRSTRIKGITQVLQFFFFLLELFLQVLSERLHLPLVCLLRENEHPPLGHSGIFTAEAYIPVAPADGNHLLTGNTIVEVFYLFDCLRHTSDPAQLIGTAGDTLFRIEGRVQLFKKRNETIEEARQQKPERWGVRDSRKWESENVVVLNPDKKPKKEQELVSEKSA